MNEFLFLCMKAHLNVNHDFIIDVNHFLIVLEIQFILKLCQCLSLKFLLMRHERRAKSYDLIRFKS